jgi:hypothetical protein
MSCVVRGWQLARGVMVCWLSLHVQSIVWNAGRGWGRMWVYAYAREAIATQLLHLSCSSGASSGLMEPECFWSCSCVQRLVRLYGIELG